MNKAYGDYQHWLKASKIPQSLCYNTLTYLILVNSNYYNFASSYYHSSLWARHLKLEEVKLHCQGSPKL